MLRFRIVMAISIEIFWFRSLAFLIVAEFLGPSLVAIGRMVRMVESACIEWVNVSVVAERSAVLHVHHRGGDFGIWRGFSVNVLQST